MYTVIGKDRVIPVDIPFQSTGAPEPFLVATDGNLFLSFLGANDEELIVVEFVGSRARYFGSPNDEALSGHPLYGRGLEAYGAGEVLNSSWIRELERANRVHPMHDARGF